MNSTRRIVLSGCAALAVTACAPRAATGDGGDLFFIGSNGTTLSAARIDPRTGAMRLIGPVAQAGKPTWTVAERAGARLYATDQAAGTALAFKVNPANGALTPLGSAPSDAGVTHLWLDARSRSLLAANYSAGSVASIAINPDGSLGERVSVIAAKGSGPHRRQASPHAHGVALDPSGRFALVADLGTDRLYIYPFDPAARQLTDPGAQANHLILPPGSGPRHFAFHPDGKTFFLLGELSAQVFVARWNAKAGTAELVETVSANAPGFSGTSTVSEVVVSRDGRFVYVGNRGDATIVAFAVDPRTRHLTEIQRIGSGGDYPWDLRIHPNGRWMIVANERSSNLTVFAVEPKTGRLTATGQQLETPRPVNISFY